MDEPQHYKVVIPLMVISSGKYQLVTTSGVRWRAWRDTWRSQPPTFLQSLRDLPPPTRELADLQWEMAMGLAEQPGWTIEVAAGHVWAYVRPAARLYVATHAPDGRGDAGLNGRLICETAEPSLMQAIVTRP